MCLSPTRISKTGGKARTPARRTSTVIDLTGWSLRNSHQQTNEMMASMTPVARHQSCAFLIGVCPQVAQSGRRDIDRRCHSYLALAGQATQFTLYSCEQRVRNHSCFSGSIHGSYCQIDHLGTERSDPMTLPSDIGGSLSWVELCTDSRLASSGIPISGFLRRPSRRTLRV